MGILDRWFKKEPVQELEVVPVAPVVQETSLTYHEPVTHINRGSWVKTPNGQIGIATKIGPEVEITLTTADGSTIMEIVDGQIVPSTLVYAASQVTRASISDIPRNRYESVEQLKALGYGD